MFDVEKIRKDFPVLQQKVYGNPLIYLDNGATTQKPSAVIEKISSFYSHRNSSIHRGIHFLSEQATVEYESARNRVKEFINAEQNREIIFTAGTTASINSVAFSFGEKYIKTGDEIILTEMEHHANIVPWQMLCDRKGCKLKIVPIDDNGDLLLEGFEKMFTPKTRILAITHISNALGTINPVKEMIKTAHANNVPVMVDGAQSVQHGVVDVRDLDCDFFVFSGHKIYGPTGIGVLYGKEKWLEEMPPYQGGGDMIKNVTFEKTTYNDLPFKFEAGTTNYVGAVGLAAALDYVTETGRKEIEEYESELSGYAHKKLSQVEGLKFFGTSANKISILSFLIEGIHQYDAGMIIDKLGIAVRTGTHCAQPVMDHFGIDGTIRASLAFYNTKKEIDRLYDALLKVKQMLG